MTQYQITTSGTGRQAWRILIDGQLQRTPNGRVAIYSESGAHKALEALQGELEDVEPVEAPAASPSGVLNTSKRRLDGLTHEEAAERFSAPPPLLCVASSPRQVVLVQNGQIATYTLKAGQIAVVEVSVKGAVIYNGTLTGLVTLGTRSKYAAQLAPWKRITQAHITDYLRGVDL